MSAGMPGVGIAALFFVLAALWGLVAEVALTARGRSSVARWRVVGRQSGIAAGVIAVTVLTGVGLDALVSNGSPAGNAVPLALVLTSSVLVLVLVASAAQWILAGRKPPPAPVKRLGSPEPEEAAAHRRAA